MWAVIITEVINVSAPEIYGFNTKEDARAFLLWKWEDDYNDVIANGNDYDEDNCWHEEDYAALDFDDKLYRYEVVELAKPYGEEWKKYVHKA